MQRKLYIFLPVFFFYISPYSWFNDALTQERRKLGRFHQTLLMTLILQIFVISVCKIEDAALFDEAHFHKMTSNGL